MNRMIYRLIALVLLISMLLMLVSCGNDKQPQNEVSSTPIADEPTDNYPTPKLTLSSVDSGSIILDFCASNGYFYNYNDKNWSFSYLKGVNIGLTEPTTDLSNPDTSYATYIDWFGKISGMNANTIKVSTVMNPNFYKALYDYNAEHFKNPLYLLQGITFDENYLTEIGNAWDSDGIIINAFKASINLTLDVIHGKSKNTEYGNFSPAIYDNDVSKYVAGYILGPEWTSEFVSQTNALNNTVTTFAGEYLTAVEGTTPFEIFLAQMGDYLITYETMQYSHQTPVAFLNSPTTDVLSHSNEPNSDNDAVSVNTENIKTTPKYYAGLFAAVNIFPYYPEFLNYQNEYADYVDFYGKINSYRSYLDALIAQYSVPVIIAEFGLSTSRTIANESVMGYNLGRLTEEQQGKYIVEMLNDIAKEGYAGSMIYSWQDDWHENTWNSITYVAENPSLITPNSSSAKQSFGILAFDAASGYSDGNTTEWMGAQATISNDDYEVFTKYDAAYLHIYINVKGEFNFDTDALYVPISTVARGSNYSKAFNLTFDTPTDFLLVINGEKNTRILSDAYNDVFHYVYAVQNPVFPVNSGYAVKNSGIFNQINTILSDKMYLPDDDITIEAKSYESGLLTFGKNNPNLSDYNSLADFYATGKKIEIRIPWSLLNIVNSASGVSIGDFYAENQISFSKISDIKIGIAKQSESVTLTSIGYNGLDKITYKSRLKKSYSVIADALKDLMNF